MPRTSDSAAADPALALQWESRPWTPNDTYGGMSRAQRARSINHYNAAVPAEIATLSLAIEPEVAAGAEDARAEITRFDSELSMLFPGEFAPLASVLLRTESASSSQIENITAGAGALSLAEIGLGKYGTNASLVAANVDAMQRAIDLAGNVTPDGILEIHEALMRGQKHADPGEYRTQQDWIGGRDLSPHDAAFVPPHHDRVVAAINDLCIFANRTDFPLITQIAVAHAQFETIHPFNDGNGRTGRALVHAMLKRHGATTRTTVPVSAGLLTDTQTYFEALTAYRTGNPNPIVTRFTDASFSAVSNGRHLAADLKGLIDRWNGQLTARKDAVAWRVLPYLLQQPSVTSKLVQDQTGVSQPAADNALKQLQGAEVLSRPRTVEGAERQRNVVWQATEVIEALDAFAERARRRPESA